MINRNIKTTGEFMSHCAFDNNTNVFSQSYGQQDPRYTGYTQDYSQQYATPDYSTAPPVDHYAQPAYDANAGYGK